MFTIPLRPTVLRLAGAYERAFERHFWRWSALFVILLLASLIVRDVRAKLWTDEFFTLFAARQSGPAAIVKASIDGLDGSPPLYATIVHYLLPYVGPDSLALRLPATLGYCVMLVCVLAFSRRRLGAAYAWIPALLAFVMCIYYGSEGRAYGLVLGCAGAAMLCWQSATVDRAGGTAALLLALALALATALHYYTIFLTAPLALGELVRWWRTGTPNLKVLAALACPVLVVAAHYPMIAVTRHAYTFFWSPPSWSLVIAFYNEYVRTTLYVCGGFALVALALFPPARAEVTRRSTDIPLHEWVAVVTLVLMPPIVMVASQYVTHAFVDRYILWSTIGTALAAGALLRIAAAGQPVVGLLVSGLLAAQVAGHQVRGVLQAPTLPRGENLSQALRAVPDTADPIVVADVHAFMELAFYGEPRWRDRLVYPMSRDLEMRYQASDTTTRQMTAAKAYTPLRVVDYRAVVSEYPRFVLAATPHDYLPRHLVSEGFRVSALASPGSLLLFEVSGTASSN